MDDLLNWGSISNPKLRSDLLSLYSRLFEFGVPSVFSFVKEEGK